MLGSGKFMGNQANELRGFYTGVYPGENPFYQGRGDLPALLDTHLSEQEAREMFDAMEAFVKGHAH